MSLETTDSLIKDRLVCEVKHDTVCSRLQQETNLTRQKATDICRAAETSTQQMKAIQGLSAEGNVDIVKRKMVKNKPNKAVEYIPLTSQKCRKCGYKHEPPKCSAFGKFCKNCKRKKKSLKSAKVRKCMNYRKMTVTQNVS